MNPSHALADSVGRCYLRLADAPFLRALDPFVAAGEYCALCGKGPATFGSKGQALCASCRQPWRGVPSYVPRQPGLGRRDGSDAALARYVDEGAMVRRVVDPRPRSATAAAWEFSRLAWLAGLHEKVGGAERAAELGSFLRPDLAPWTEWRVRQGARHAREVVARRVVRLMRMRAWRWPRSAA